jgi:hypothetical protein
MQSGCLKVGMKAVRARRTAFMWGDELSYGLTLHNTWKRSSLCVPLMFSAVRNHFNAEAVE